MASILVQFGKKEQNKEEKEVKSKKKCLEACTRSWIE